ncbi:MAG: DUF21 domain-containing protein [Lentisphaeria bacterium]|nr:CNNM domain-containing protein [Lentisphaeria bacterium]NQZ69862.1 DUF21 domain-containing protein [Lentisphaeria bacterium]
MPSGDTVAADYTSKNVIMLVFWVLLALVSSFLCSVAEAVLLSITPSYIEGLKEKKPKLAEKLKRLKVDDLDNSLAAILTVNTIAHTVGAIFSGTEATNVFGSELVGYFTCVMVLLILICSEIIPKTIGAVYWRSLTSISALFILTISTMIKYTGFLWFSKLITRLIGGSHAHTFSRDEFIAMAGVGERSGEIDEGESRILKNLFRFETMTAADIMTPRIVISALKAEISIATAIETADKHFSRIPIYGNDLDDINGFVLRTDLLLHKAECHGESNLESIVRKIPTVRRSQTLTPLLEQLLKDREHIAIVVGEYGETVGLLTLEDLIETLLGMEIVDEFDKVEDMQLYARQLWEKRADKLGIDVKASKEELEETDASDDEN